MVLLLGFGKKTKKRPREQVPKWLSNPVRDGKILLDKFVNLDSFEEPTFLTETDSSRIYLARHKTSGRYYVLKGIRKQSIYQRRAFDQVERQFRVHLGTNHRYLINLFRVFDHPSFVYIVQDYCVGGTLEWKLENKWSPWGGNTLSFDHIRFYVSQIASALDYLHNTRNVIHRNLHLAHVGISWNGNVKLLGFGKAVKVLRSERFLETGNHDTGEILDTVAPELLPPRVCDALAYLRTEEVGNRNANEEPDENLRLHSFEVDWWSLGVLAFRMCWGIYPFGEAARGHTDTDIAKRILKGKQLKPTALHRKLRGFPHKKQVEGVNEMIQGLLNLDIDCRWGMDDVQTCSFFSSVTDWALLQELERPHRPKHADVEADTSSFRKAQKRHLKKMKIGVFPEELVARPSQEQLAYTYFTTVCRDVMQEAMASHTSRSKQLLEGRQQSASASSRSSQTDSKMFTKLQRGYERKQERKKYQESVFKKYRSQDD